MYDKKKKSYHQSTLQPDLNEQIESKTFRFSNFIEKFFRSSVKYYNFKVGVAPDYWGMPKYACRVITFLILNLNYAHTYYKNLLFKKKISQLCLLVQISSVGDHLHTCTLQGEVVNERGDKCMSTLLVDFIQLE